MKILLVSPVNENNPDRRILAELPFLGADAFFAPHACAVIAGLTPKEHAVRIHDEAIHGKVERLLDEESFDIVGLSLVADAFVRSLEIAKRFREDKRQGLLVAGGACMLHMVQELKGLLDVAFVGEAEETWPRFLREVAEGRHQSLYRQIAKSDLTDMPLPRWELLGKDLSRYLVAAVQTARGCPHDCSFCDVIYTSGRKLRVKPADQIIKEIVHLQSMGVETIFFADDNFAANRPHAKTVLKQIIEVNKTFPRRLGFATQVDITVAEDDELLQLMLDGGFLEVQIGIESVNPASLKDLHKLHNLKADIAEAVRKIQSYGILVLAHMIVGADSDDLGVFEQVDEFLVRANVIHHACHPLMAPPGTKLWQQLRREGRLIVVSPELQDRMGLYTNVMPKRISRPDLFEGISFHNLRSSDPERFLERVRAFAEGVVHETSYKVENAPGGLRNFRMFLAMLGHYLFKAPKGERRVFFRLLSEIGRRRSSLMPRVLYALVSHSMARRRAELEAEWARFLAEKERAMPDGPAVMDKTAVIAAKIREEFKEIAETAYSRIQTVAPDRETLYRAVVEALCDYALVFGPSFEGFDDYQRDAVQKSCDRVIGRLDRSISKEGNEQSDDRPPPGFAREILDAMDQTLRFGLHRPTSHLSSS